MNKISFWISNDTKKSYTALICNDYKGDIKALVAKSITEKLENIVLEKANK